MIALYKSVFATGDPELGLEPQGPAELTARGDETFVYGQREVTEGNHCHFIHGVNSIIVNEPVSSIRSDSNKYAVIRLHELLSLGSQIWQYSFEEEGQTAAYEVKGVPLWSVLSSLGVDGYIPEGSDAYLNVISQDGSSVTIDRAAIDDSVVAWGYTDGTICPEEQTGEMAVYMPGETKEESVCFNLWKLNVVDGTGAVLTSAPSVTVTPEPEEPMTAPAVPSSFKAAAASYNSVKLTWKKSEDVSGYYIYRYNTAEKKYKKIKTLKASASSYTDEKLTTNTTYKYKICAYRTDGERVLRSKASGAVSAAPALKKTSIQRLARYQTQGAKLSWKAVSGASGYQIYRSTQKSKGYQKVGSVKKQSVCTFTDKNLKTGKTYYYKVRPYRTVNGKQKYGSFSAVKSIRR